MKNVHERLKGGGTLHAHIWGASREREDPAQSPRGWNLSDNQGTLKRQMKLWCSNRDSKGKSWSWKRNKALENYCKDFDIYAELSPESLEGSDPRGT